MDSDHHESHTVGIIYIFSKYILNHSPIDSNQTFKKIYYNNNTFVLVYYYNFNDLLLRT